MNTPLCYLPLRSNDEILGFLHVERPRINDTKTRQQISCMLKAIRPMLPCRLTKGYYTHIQVESMLEFDPDLIVVTMHDIQAFGIGDYYIHLWRIDKNALSGFSEL